MVQDMEADQTGVEILITSILSLAIYWFPHFVIELRYYKIIAACREQGGRRNAAMLPAASVRKNAVIISKEFRRLMPQASGQL